MCGITGVVARTEKGKRQHAFLDSSMHALEKRGPDGGGKFISEFVALGHRRLVVIDTSEGSMQPLTDATNRYTIVYNGECFNYQELKLELTSMGVTFKSVGDTEVLLKAYMHFGVDFVKKINGFLKFKLYFYLVNWTMISDLKFV